MGGTGTEESAAESAKWSGKDTEELVSEEEANTAGGAGEVRRILTATTKESEGSGA